MTGRPPEVSLAPGVVVASRYHVLARLGRGGMGVVYKARDAVLEETVALKVLRPDVAASPEMERRFLAEIRLARAVTHKNVCRIHEYGVDGALRYISMAYVDGADLREFLDRHGPLAPHQAYEITIQVAEALQAIHDEGIVHRDLKMANLMIDTRGIVRVMDFGIAKLEDEAADAGLTAAGHLIGTPEYMSPEQIRGEKLDGRSDVYALGVVAYELFTGRAPFRGETPVATLMRHLEMPPPLGGPEAERLPAALIPILDRVLAKDREARFATAAEMAAALRAAAAGVPTVPIRPTEAIGAGALDEAPGPTVTALDVGGGEPARAAEATFGRPSAGPRAARRWVAPAVVAAVAGVAVLVSVAAVVVSRRGDRPTTPGTVATPSPPPPSDSVTAEASSPTTLDAVTSAAARSASTPVPPPQSLPRAERTPPPARPPAPPSQPDVLAPDVANAVAGLLTEAEAAVSDGQCQLALGFYAEVRRLDPGNARARLGEQFCKNAPQPNIPAGAAVQAPRVTAPPSARAFVSGQTRHAGEPARRGPAGFEDSAGVAVRRLEQALAPAGKIVFEVEPRELGPGDRFTLRAYLVNESAGPLDVRQVTATTTLNGGRASGGLPLPSRPIAPGDKAILLSLQDVWKSDVTSWSLALTVRVASGEVYLNELTWK